MEKHNDLIPLSEVRRLINEMGTRWKESQCMKYYACNYLAEYVFPDPPEEVDVKLWEVVVFESIARRVRYTVEANTLDEAKDKVAIGETIEETVLSSGEVLCRKTDEDPTQIFRPTYSW